MKTILILFISIVFDLGFCEAQKATNIKAEQVGQTIQVSYNLENESPCIIALFYSTDNGSTWQGPLKKVSGDVGEKISSGNKKITWDVLNEMEQLKFSSVVFKIDARKLGLKEVKIGNQIWSAENLNVDYFANGDKIKGHELTIHSWENAAKDHSPMWCNSHFDSSIARSYGKLYNWYAISDPRGLCPIGWRIPSQEDWNKLEIYLGGSSIAGGKLKKNGYYYWGNNNIVSNNLSGFNAIPGGVISPSGSFYDEEGLWWSSSESKNDSVVFRWIKSENTSFYIGVASKSTGFSVRCIKDSELVDGVSESLYSNGTDVVFDSCIIGDQIWSTENLNVTKYANGDEIQQINDSSAWSNLTSGAWCYYENDSNYETGFGKLYNWYAVADPRGLCPTGWHVPNDDEWSTLETTLGDSLIAGQKLKEIGYVGWNRPYSNIGEINYSCFSGLPSGARNFHGQFLNFGLGGYWWSSTESSSTDAYDRFIDDGSTKVNRYSPTKRAGLSIRCVKD